MHAMKAVNGRATSMVHRIVVCGLLTPLRMIGVRWGAMIPRKTSSTLM